MCTNNSKWQFFIQRDVKRTSFCICSVCVRARVCVWLRGGETLSVSIAVLRLLSLPSVFYINSCTSSTQPWSWSHPSHSLLSLSFTVKHLEIIPCSSWKPRLRYTKRLPGVCTWMSLCAVTQIVFPIHTGDASVWCGGKCAATQVVGTLQQAPFNWVEMSHAENDPHFL